MTAPTWQETFHKLAAPNDDDLCMGATVFVINLLHLWERVGCPEICLGSMTIHHLKDWFSGAVLLDDVEQVDAVLVGVESGEPPEPVGYRDSGLVLPSRHIKSGWCVYIPQVFEQATKIFLN
jgi:hypothetical protein